MVSEKYAIQVERRLRRGNIGFVVKVPDVEKLINENEGNGTSCFSKRLQDDPIFDSEPDSDLSRVGRLKKIKYPFGDYASYSDMMKYMRTIEFYYPNITKIIRLGTTHEGKPIEGLKIGFPIGSTHKRAIWVDGNIHAREWASSHTALFFINQLVSNYGKDETITHYVNNLNFFVLPCLNPDGYEYTRSSSIPSVRLWRKNRSPEKCHKSLWGGEKCCQGVDLNRNFQFHWAESGSSFEPCSNIYHGEHVFSEPEALAVRDFLDSEDMKGKVDAFVTLHSYAQLWIYPYSHAEMSYPDDINELRRTARRAINRLHRMYGTEYRMGTGADTLAPASGGSDDWAKSVMGIKYVYLVELRPEMELSNGFILHKKELIPTAVETFEGVKEVIDAVLEHNNIHMDPISKISPLLRKKQLYRMRLLGLTSSINQEPKTNLTDITDISEKQSEPPIDEETTVPPSVSMELMTEISSEVTMVPTRSKPWLTYKPRSHMIVDTQWKSLHFDRFTSQIPDWDSTTQLSTLETDVETFDEESAMYHPTPPSSPPIFNPDMTTQAQSVTTDFAFYTNTKPISFKDPSCRDMRYSCAFWLKHNRKVCSEQLSFMRAQCAFTCRFCTPHSNFMESDAMS